MGVVWTLEGLWLRECIANQPKRGQVAMKTAKRLAMIKRESTKTEPYPEKPFRILCLTTATEMRRHTTSVPTSQSPLHTAALSPSFQWTRPLCIRVDECPTARHADPSTIRHPSQDARLTTQSVNAATAKCYPYRVDCSLRL